GRLLLRRAPPARRRDPPPQGPLDRRADPAARGRDPRAAGRRPAAQLQAAHELVHRPSPRVPPPPRHHPPLGRRRAAPSLPAAPGWAATGPRRRREMAHGPPLAGPRALLRVLPRRHRRRHRREPPDGLDRPRGQAPPTERRVTGRARVGDGPPDRASGGGGTPDASCRSRIVRPAPLGPPTFPTTLPRAA